MSRGRPLLRYPVENAYRLDISKLQRNGWFRSPGATWAVMRWMYPWDEEPERAIVTVNMADTASLTVQFDGEDTMQRIELVSTPQRFGGVRWWMRCPFTRRRCRVLYLPNGGRLFASRQAYGLVYRTQQLSPEDRAYQRVHRLAARLGAEYGDEIEKPKGMRWHTFERIAEQLDAAYVAVDGFFLAKVARWPGIAEQIEALRNHGPGVS